MSLFALALHFWLFAPALHAQGSRKDDIVFNSRGVPLAGATVRVCTMPATGQPCTPLANIYSNSTLTQALANPTTTDGMGNYYFYAAPGKYMIEISGPGITTKQIPDVIIPVDPTAPSFSGNISAFSLTLSGNLTVSGNTTVVGNMAGGTLTMTDQSTPPGAASAGTVNLYVKSSDKRLYYKDDTGTEIGPISTASGAQTTVTNTFTAAQNFDADVHTKGPNPYIDITRYGARASAYNSAPVIPGITASCTSGSPNVTISSVSNFVNGDGVVLYNCGAAHSMSTPGAPTVTPSQSSNGTGTGMVVNAPAGSTTYSYVIVARNKQQGLTAASAQGTTTTGPASLGSQSVGISSQSRSNNTVTVTTSAAHGLAQGAQILIVKASDGSFSGWFTVASVIDSTHFTYQSPVDTRDGASTSSTGGTVFWWNCNHLTWAAVSGAWQYYIYGRTSGSLTLLGVSQTQGATQNLFFDDFGATMMGTPSLPYFVPTTPPASATNNSLVTTISSGAGTTSLVLAANAGNTASGQTILLDSGSALLAAAGSGNTGMLYIPFSSSGVFPINSFVSLPSGIGVTQVGQVSLNDTLALGNYSHWRGEAYPQGISYASFSNVGGATLGVGRAYPGIYVGGYSAAIEKLSVTLPPNGLGIEIDQVTPFTLSDTQFSSGATDYMGMGFLALGIINNTSFSLTFRNLALIPDSTPQVGSTATPFFFCDYCGQTRMDNINMNLRGISYLGADFELHYGREQQGILPPVNLTSINNSIFAEISDYEEDTTAQSLLSLNGAGASVVINRSGFPSTDGVSIPSLVTGSFSSSTFSILNDPGFNSTYPQSAWLTGGNLKSTSSITSSGQGLLGYLMPTPGAPTNPTVSSGGSVPVATWYYALTAVDAFGNESALSPISSGATTTSGNQTVTITLPTPPPGAVGWTLYRGTTPPYLTREACAVGTYSISSSTIVDTASGNCGPNPGPPLALSSGAGPLGVSSNRYFLNNNTLASPSGATGQTWTFADHSTQYAPGAAKPSSNIGFTLESGILQSAFDNFNRANGAIGSNWTVMTGGLNVSGNQLVGTSATDNRAYYSSASAPVTADQFSQLTLGNVPATGNGTYPMVRASGSGSTADGYMCGGGASGTLYLQKITNGADSVITSTSFSPSVGDVIRLEAVGSTLNCYYNGVLKLTSTDSSFPAGSPALEVYNTGAIADNWSGGNLHPIAQLDTEQDWAQPQHFPLGITVGPLSLAGTPPSGITLGAESFNSVPRAFIPTFLPGALTSTWTGSTIRLDKAITVTRVQVQAKTAPAGCSTNTVVQLTDGTTPVNVTVSAAANDSGALSQNYAAGASLTLAVQTAAAGCTTSPADANVLVQFRMQ